MNTTVARCQNLPECLPQCLFSLFSTDRTELYLFVEDRTMQSLFPGLLTSVGWGIRKSQTAQAHQPSSDMKIINLTKAEIWGSEVDHPVYEM